MWFWWFMLCCDLLIPIIMLIAGWLMWKHPPKNINGVIGYRTSRSMKNKDTWKFAHEHCGKLWWKLGWILLIPSIIAILPVYGSTENGIASVGLAVMAVQMVVLIASIFPTERALKRTFTDNGSER